MTKNMWIALAILVLIIAAGLIEVTVLGREYGEFHDKTEALAHKAYEGQLSSAEFSEYRQYDWKELRENSELLLPHLDVYEINLRIADAQAYLDRGDTGNAYNQIMLVYELTEYVPHLMKPIWRHIF